MTRRLVLAALALIAAGCSVIGAGETLTYAQQVIADIKIEPADLRIVGGVDHADRHYRVGEPITLSLEVSKPAFVAVLRVLPNGVTTLVLPNQYQSAAQMPADRVEHIPGPGMPLAIAVDKPGTVLFEFIALTRGDSWLFRRKPAGAANFAELGSTTRALARDVLLSLKVGHGGDAAIAHLLVQVEDR